VPQSIALEYELIDSYSEVSELAGNKSCCLEATKPLVLILFTTLKKKTNNKQMLLSPLLQLCVLIMSDEVNMTNLSHLYLYYSRVH